MGVPLVSIIVPVYNVEKYICKCIKSILDQTFNDFELILIDDGSSDSSGKIIDDLAKTDVRIVVSHKQNSGVSSARNYGLSVSRGKWIIFVDSDDYVGERYVADLISHAESDSIVIQGLTKVSAGVNLDVQEYENAVYGGNDILNLFERGEFFERGFPVAKVFDRDLLIRNDIRFNEKIHYSEDLIFMLEYIKHSKNVKTISGSNYFYQISASHLSQKYNSFISEYCLFECFYSLTCEIARIHGGKQSEIAKKQSALMLMRSIYAMYVNREYRQKEIFLKVRTIFLEQKAFIKDYYQPQIVLFRIAKRLLLFSPAGFHLFCLFKFSYNSR